MRNSTLLRGTGAKSRFTKLESNTWIIQHVHPLLYAPFWPSSTCPPSTPSASHPEATEMYQASLPWAVVSYSSEEYCRLGFIVLLFGPEDGGGIFFRNAGIFLLAQTSWDLMLYNTV
jgi:hypothetical protein